MKTEETNKLIAEFMNCENSQAWKLIPSPYECDWNWLMEVVEKIESLDGNIHICNNDVFVHFPKRCRKLIRVNGERLKINRIEAVYKACVEFIKWYNSADKN